MDHLSRTSHAIEDNIKEIAAKYNSEGKFVYFPPVIIEKSAKNYFFGHVMYLYTAGKQILLKHNAQKYISHFVISYEYHPFFRKKYDFTCFFSSKLVNLERILYWV